MFGELPKLFGRNFALGFLLPFAVFAFFSLLLLERFSVLTSAFLPLLLEAEEALLATVFLFLVWLGGVLLLALNRSIIRLKEGYGTLNPARALAFLERNRFKRLVERAEALEADIIIAEKRGEDMGPAAEKELDDARKLLAWRFPDSERFLLPTAFGNTMRAFEVYSRVMYGLDAIPAWPRLLMLIPDNNRDLVDTAKTQMNFWINLWCLSFVFLLQYVVLTVRAGDSRAFWAWLALPLAWLASRRARNAAVLYGETVKAAFDIYIPQLRKQLELSPSSTPEQAREQWTDMSSAMIYRNRDRLPE